MCRRTNARIRLEKAQLIIHRLDVRDAVIGCKKINANEGCNSCASLAELLLQLLAVAAICIASFIACFFFTCDWCMGAGALKMQDMKMHDLKLTDQCAGHEITGHENDGPMRGT